jgi:hypothetical protein
LYFCQVLSYGSRMKIPGQTLCHKSLFLLYLCIKRETAGPVKGPAVILFCLRSREVSLLRICYAHSITGWGCLRSCLFFAPLACAFSCSLRRQGLADGPFGSMIQRSKQMLHSLLRGLVLIQTSVPAPAAFRTLPLRLANENRQGGVHACACFFSPVARGRRRCLATNS